MTDTFDPKQLEAFCAVVAEGGVTAAAQALGRSQPSVTRQIQDLEATLGFPLIEKSGRGVVPTELGLLFYRDVVQHLASLQRLSDRAAAIKKGSVASLDIAAIPAFVVGLVPEAIAGLKDANKMPSHVRAAGGEEVVDLVRRGISDLGISSLPIRSPGLRIEWAVEADCIAVLREDDPLSRFDVLALKALRGARIITTANPYREGRHVEEALRASGVSRPVPLDTNTSFSAMAVVRAGLGVALIEPLTPAWALLPGLTVRPINVSIPFGYCAITREGAYLAPWLQDLIQGMPTLLESSVPGVRRYHPTETATEIAGGSLTLLPDRIGGRASA